MGGHFTYYLSLCTTIMILNQDNDEFRSHILKHGRRTALLSYRTKIMIVTTRQVPSYPETRGVVGLKDTLILLFNPGRPSKRSLQDLQPVMQLSSIIPVLLIFISTVSASPLYTGSSNTGNNIQAISVRPLIPCTSQRPVQKYFI